MFFVLSLVPVAAAAWVIVSVLVALRGGRLGRVGWVAFAVLCAVGITLGWRLAHSEYYLASTLRVVGLPLPAAVSQFDEVTATWPAKMPDPQSLPVAADLFCTVGFCLAPLLLISRITRRKKPPPPRDGPGGDRHM